MKAGWIFVKNNGNNEPNLPSVGGTWTNPCEIHTITGGPSGFEHTHLLIGGIAQPSSDRAGEADELHRHYVIPFGSGYYQETLNATSHTHDLNLVNGVLSPQWYLIFWYGSNADAVIINGDTNCIIAVEADVTADPEGGYFIGDLDDTDWTTAERDLWETRVDSVLGIELPTVVTNGKRLVAFFVGALVGRPSQTEKSLRRIHS